MRLIGIEPTHTAPEAIALSTELQTHLLYCTIFFPELQALILLLFKFVFVKITPYDHKTYGR